MRRAAVLLLALVGACSDDFVKGWLVDRPRVLGARVEGQSVSWLVARAPHVAWAYAVCADTKLNAPRCDSPVLAAATGTADAEVVTMALATAPPSTLVLAAFCTGGEAALEPVAFTATCADGGEALLASVKIGDGTNAQPAAPALRVPEGCVAPGSRHDIGFSFRDEDREAGETLLASTTVTDGELDRQYTALAPSEAPRDVTIPWVAPAGSADVGFYLVLRDGRGGAAFTTARVCVR